MNKEKIIIDTDIGDDVDDSFALALAFKMENIDIVGITTVFKNCDMRTKIVKAELEAFNKTGIDVINGLDNPLAIPPSIFSYEKVGANGKPIITAFDESYNKYSSSGYAPDYLLQKCKEYPGEITLVAIGPLTNLATAITKDPEGFKNFKRIIMMGGSNCGNKEWNIMCDPEAANIVLNCGVPITMIPIECTIKCEVKQHHYGKIMMSNNKEQEFLLNMYTRWRKNQTRPCQMHDALAMQELVNSFCEFEERNIVAPLTNNDRGKTINNKKGHLNARMATNVRAEEFVDHLINTLYQ